MKICNDCGIETSKFGLYGSDPVLSAVPVCYECCGKRDEAQMRETGKIVLYLEESVAFGVRHPSSRKPTQLTNWPGTLKFQVGHYTFGRHNLAKYRTDVWFNDNEGHTWHGVQYGLNSDLCRCKRLK